MLTLIESTQPLPVPATRRLILALSCALCLACEFTGAEIPKGSIQSEYDGRIELRSEPSQGDVLFISDNDNGTVVKFDACTGEYLGKIKRYGFPGKVRGPRGIVLDETGRLLVVNQNVNLDINGEVLAFDPVLGEYLGELIPASAQDAPFGPRGMVLSIDGSEVIVADLGIPTPGRLSRFRTSDGEFLGDFDTAGLDGPFAPRGVVFGPDGYLYVANTNLPNLVGGSVLRFDPQSHTFVNVVVDDTCCGGGSLEFHRPEGLSFSPDGELYVTSFRNPDTINHPTVDGILVFAVADGVGELVDTIPLYQTGQPRAFAQALLFGPGGLFVPISGGGPDTGTVRRYDVLTKQYDLFVDEPNGHLDAGWYLSFGETDPSTLSYAGETDCGL